MKNSQKGFAEFIVILIIAVVALGLVGFNLYKSGKILTSPSQTPTATPSENIDETANWKKYRNEEYGFELKYPSTLSANKLGPNYSQQELNAGRQISGTIEPSLDTIVFEDQGKNSLFQIGVFDSSFKNLTTNDYVDHLYTSGLCDLRWDFQQTSVELQTYANLNVLKVSGTNSFNNVQGYQNCYYFTNNRDLLIVLSISHPIVNKSDLNHLDKTIDQILSTFQFTN